MRTVWNAQMIHDWLSVNCPTLVPSGPTGCPAHTKVRCGWECKVCGQRWETTFNKIKEKGTRCPTCSRKNAPRQTGHLHAHIAARRLTLEGVVAKLAPRRIRPYTFEPLGGVTSSRMWLCEVCGHTWEATVCKVVTRAGKCPECLRREPAHNRLPLSALLDRLKDREDVEYVEGYQHTMAKCSWKCRTCGFGWEATPQNVLRGGQGCPECAQGRREREVGTSLRRMLGNTEVIPQWRVECPLDIRGRGWVRVDYFIPELRCVVEYHGRQHYEHVPFFHRRRGVFEAQRRRDSWLRQYCAGVGLHYIEIPYTERNIEAALSRALSAPPRGAKPWR